jgi:capsular polysaccharide transport system permease protein
MTDSVDISTQPQTPPEPVARKRRFASVRAIMALVLREMETTYGRSPGGYIWAVLEPAAGIALLTFIFSLAFRAPPIGINFPMFYATGMVPFLMYMDISNKISQSIHFSRPLLVYPSVTYVDALIGRFLLNTLTQILVAYIIFAGIFFIFETRTSPDLMQIALALAMTGCLAFGIGTLNCFLNTRFPIWQRVWGIINRPMFILSCIFFVFETVPQPYRDILWWNPLVHLVGQMRAAFYPSYDAAYVSPTYVFGIALICAVFGLVFLTRFHRDLLNN